MRCLFSRSVEHSKYDLRHVCFEEYVAMLLNTKSYQRLLDTDLYEKLIADFGILSGINEKETIYYIPEKENFSDKNNLKIIEYYNQLNDIGKHEATKRVEELTHLPQYKLEQCNPNDNVLAAHAKENQSDEDVASDIDFIKSLKQKLDKELDKDKS